MRARYYSPDMRRFVNADIVAGAISNAVTLNRFAYANGNPVSFASPGNSNLISSISTDSEYAVHNLNTPEIKSLTGDAGQTFGVYYDEEKAGVGVSSASRIGEWTVEGRTQTSFESTVNTNSIIYAPKDKNLPIVSVSMEEEIYHFAKLALAGAVVVAVVAPELVATGAPALMDLVSKFGSLPVTLPVSG